MGSRVMMVVVYIIQGIERTCSSPVFRMTPVPNLITRLISSIRITYECSTDPISYLREISPRKTGRLWNYLWVCLTSNIAPFFNSCSCRHSRSNELSHYVSDYCLGLSLILFCKQSRDNSCARCQR